MTEIEKISEELAEYGVPDELIGKIEDLLATLYGEKRKLEIEKSWIFLQSQWVRKISDSVAIYSDGKKLHVIHNLGDEFILDFKVGEDSVWNLNGQVVEIIDMIEPVFKVFSFCSKSGEGMQRLKHAIVHFEKFEQYIRDNQEDLMIWWHNPGGEYD
ncbi:Uncharacterised protein [Streptococcus pneumoniae]|uniref:Uncharacterized protein n=1 Tax=Streptococcus pneumoniae TaxID=1313 RepID=A0A4J1SI99_STREE|nr:Uncharacterised protein [Streptococcus pneumoniae]VIR54806.1 Uncharacterised protein [Streptococcus pneumoniae]VJB59438.1 Uncharacterised protein [Streptococcus pneumoniae]VJC58244.1 Uncharacterised protein [Streptococcus pneumoniae]VJF93998.1 Uncharacterised protein [Streptococcus pneumoniae]